MYEQEEHLDGTLGAPIQGAKMSQNLTQIPTLGWRSVPSATKFPVEFLGGWMSEGWEPWTSEWRCGSFRNGEPCREKESQRQEHRFESKLMLVWQLFDRSGDQIHSPRRGFAFPGEGLRPEEV
eukprot:TRINITY_DN2070_c0_g2_i2.p2 TRINITY_DN2070_c0_g2~~TRINITY_DN2070_c0_g2_i2.p2  ORF type:complete len:123 (+),score=4.81 TRINITY_DN2070_c0_g2_i2:181-549(+)